MQPQDVARVLADPLAVELMQSSTPARLAYMGPDGFPRAIARSDSGLHVLEILGDEIEKASVRAHARDPFFLTGATAEQLLEDDPRVDLHRERRRLRLPAQGVHVRAAEAGRAVANQAAEVLGRQFE